MDTSHTIPWLAQPFYTSTSLLLTFLLCTLSQFPHMFCQSGSWNSPHISPHLSHIYPTFIPHLSHIYPTIFPHFHKFPHIGIFPHWGGFFPHCHQTPRNQISIIFCSSQLRFWVEFECGKNVGRNVGYFPTIFPHFPTLRKSDFPTIFPHFSHSGKIETVCYKVV